MATIAELLLARGRQEGDALRRRGESSAAMWSNLGGTAANALMSYAQQKELEPIRQQEQKIRDLKVAELESDAASRTAAGEAERRFSGFLQQWDGKPDTLVKGATMVFGSAGPEKAEKIWKGFQAIQGDPQKQYKDTQLLLRDVLLGMNELPEDVRAQVWKQTRQGLLDRGVIQESDAKPDYSEEEWNRIINFGQTPKAPVQVEGVDAEGNPQTQFVVPEAGLTVPKPAPKLTYAAPQFYVVNGKKTLVRPASDGSLRDLKGAVIDAASVQPMPTAEGAPERPSVWIAKDGNMRYVTPTEASKLSGEGWKPGNTREQGRPVTSGDAGRIAEFKTSLDDLKVLRSTLSETKDATGTVAKVGAMLPNWATEITGWGTDAKKRQGVIDRVKQVIGKALEGGVLRKEDEYKYEKILPTIYDTPEVAKAKLDGLEAALIQRQATFIDSLSDAGYDTTAYGERQQQNQASQSRDPLGIR